MKAMVTLYALAILTLIGYGLYHAPWFVIAMAAFPFVWIIARCLLDDHRRLRERNGGAL